MYERDTSEPELRNPDHRIRVKHIPPTAPDPYLRVWDVRCNRRSGEFMVYPGRGLGYCAICGDDLVVEK